MPQRQKPFLRVSRIRRGDGTIREYFYNSKTKEAYGTDRAIAEARFAEWLAALAPGQPIGRPTLGDAIRLYYECDGFCQNLAPRTRDLYRHYLEQLRVRFGKHALHLLDAEFVEALRDELKAQPSKCYQTLNGLQVVLNLAIQKKLVPGPNPVIGVKRIKSEPRTAVWTQEQIAQFVAVARPSLRLAAQLLLYTAQRLSDVLGMTKGRVSEREGRLYIALRQQKTGELLDVPVHASLESALRARLADPAGGLMLVPSPTGRMWARRNFSRAWDATRRKAGLPPLQRRDLRRTAVVYMAMAGLPVPQIGAITGHSIRSIEDILRVYLPRRTEVALAGIALWEAAAPPRLDNVVALASAKRAKR